MENILYIGLSGYAGSGKDTVAKALALLLSKNWKDYDEFRQSWEKDAFTSAYATFMWNKATSPVLCVAFADQLKHVCSCMFGIPVEHFYYDKENAWIDIKDNFAFTTIKPKQDEIITAEEYYYEMNSNDTDKTKHWMSLREALVYVGTYVCQMMVNKNTFVNGVENIIRTSASSNKKLEYAICTDVRFYHELEYIKNHHGINISIVRPTVQQLGNIAEHEIDDFDEYDYIIENDSTYDDLLVKLWDLVHDELIFRNITMDIHGHENSLTLRKISNDKWITCSDSPIVRVGHDDDGEDIWIKYIDFSGGPLLEVGATILGGTISSIKLDKTSKQFEIYVK